MGANMVTMLDHKPPPNWVERRANCDLAVVFEALHQIVQRDVEVAQKLPVERRGGCSFEIKTSIQGTRPLFGVVKNSADGSFLETVLFERRENHIEISSDVCVRARWDESTGECRFVIDEQAYELWQISEKSSWPIVFWRGSSVPLGFEARDMTGQRPKLKQRDKRA